MEEADTKTFIENLDERTGRDMFRRMPSTNFDSVVNEFSQPKMFGEIALMEPDNNLR